MVDATLMLLYIMYMPRASATVARLRNQLARILRRVERGEEVIVTRHGQGVAKLVPVRNGADRLAASGVRPAERRAPLPRVRPSTAELRHSLTRAVLEDRG